MTNQMSKRRIPVVVNEVCVGSVSVHNNSIDAAKLAETRSAHFGIVVLKGIEQYAWIGEN